MPETPKRPNAAFAICFDDTTKVYSQTEADAYIAHLEAQLQTVLARESATQARHDAKMHALEIMLDIASKASDQL